MSPTPNEQAAVDFAALDQRKQAARSWFET
jgi:hypothetical protein